MTSRYATAKEIAAYYCMSQSSAYKLMREMLETPESGAVRIGALIRVNPEKVEEYLRKKGERHHELQTEIPTEE